MEWEKGFKYGKIWVSYTHNGGYSRYGDTGINSGENI